MQKSNNFDIDKVIAEEEEKLKRLSSEAKKRRTRINLLKVHRFKEKYIGQFVRIDSCDDDVTDEFKDREGMYMYITNIWSAGSGDIGETEVFIEGHGFSYRFCGCTSDKEDTHDGTSFHWSPFIEQKYNLLHLLTDEGYAFSIIDYKEYEKRFNQAVEKAKWVFRTTDYQSLKALPMDMPMI